MGNDSDLRHLRRALTLAARGRYRTSPNPMVGAVVVAGGKVVGEGWHRRAGEPHAEVEALEAAGDRARGATLYVNLEPCDHHGRTPPCSERVLESGIGRVVTCHRDPSPEASGGLVRLADWGVAVESGFLIERAVRLNWHFLTAAVLGRPAVTVKWAMSLDGKITTVAGDSQWISSHDGRHWGLRQREEHDAILVGSGTALADDPRLDRRLGHAERPNMRVVLDRRLRLPPAARMLAIEGDVQVYTESSDRARAEGLAERGATVIRLPDVAPGAVLADLYERGVRSLLIEGGAGVAAAFVDSGLFDRVAVDCAPLLIAGEKAPGPLGGAGFPVLAQAPRLVDFKAERRGEDVILSGFRESCLQALYASVDG